MSSNEIPMSLEAEQAVLGCILIEPESLIAVMDRLTAEMFFAERHRMIWQAIMALTERAVPPDMLAVTEELRAAGRLDKIGGVAYLTQLPDMVGSTGNIEYYAAIVRQKYTRRMMIQAARRIAELAKDEDGDMAEQAAEAERLIFAATNAEAEGKFREIGEVAYTFWNNAYGHRGKGASGVPTGFRKLDIATGGFQPGDVIILAARPGQGKTTLALQIAHHVAKIGKPVAFFSLEMSAEQIANRLMVGLGKFNNQAIRQRSLQPAEWDAGFDITRQLQDIPLAIDDQAGITTTQIRARARRLKVEKRDLGLIVIDYLQLLADMPPYRGASRAEQVGMMARRCKQLARELETPVLLLSQLNRSIEGRADKKPTLADLRESGEIEQVADVVIFIYRPDEHSDVRELLIEKQRMLPPGKVSGFSFINSWFVEDVIPFSRPAPPAAAAEARRLFGEG